MKRIIYISICFIIGFSCNPKDTKTVFHEQYTGPLLELDDVNTILSDSAKLKMRIIAKKQFEFVNGDRTFPQGLKIVFYKKDESEDAILTSQKGKYNKAKDLYTVTGNVVIQNPVEKKKLTTEELNWNPITKRVFTDKFVVIQTASEILKGEGLEAPQDFSTYKIKKVTGIFSVKQ